MVFFEIERGFECVTEVRFWQSSSQIEALEEYYAIKPWEKLQIQQVILYLVYKIRIIED